MPIRRCGDDGGFVSCFQLIEYNFEIVVMLAEFSDDGENLQFICSFDSSISRILINDQSDPQSVFLHPGVSTGIAFADVI